MQLCAILLATACGRPSVDDPPNVRVAADRATGDAVVIVQDLEGRPLEGASVWFKDAGKEDYLNGDEVITSGDGAASSRDRSSTRPPFNTNEEGFDVVACHPGHRSAVLKGFAGVATVRLPPSSPTRVRVHIAEGSVLPEPPHRLDVRLDWCNADGEDDPRMFDPLPIGERTSADVLEFLVDDPGTYILCITRSVRAGDLRPDDPRPDVRMMNFVTTDPEIATVTIGYGQKTEDIEVRIVEPRQLVTPDDR